MTEDRLCASCFFFCSSSRRRYTRCSRDWSSDVCSSDLYGPMRDLTRGWTKLQEAVPSAERFFEILDQPSETPDAADAVRLTGIRHGLRISKVSFSYGRAPALRGGSLRVEKGERGAG